MRPRTLSEAVHLVEQSGAQLALVDVILGEEDGIRCVRRIKALQPAIADHPDHRLSRPRVPPAGHGGRRRGACWTRRIWIRPTCAG